MRDIDIPRDATIVAIVRDDLPFGIGRLPGLEPSLFGLVLVVVILFQPGGINGLSVSDR